jgi:hypothetical protein
MQGRQPEIAAPSNGRSSSELDELVTNGTRRGFEPAKGREVSGRPPVDDPTDR